MRSLNAFLLGVVVMVTAAALDPCPPKFEIGQTYNQIKAGPCPDIENRATFKASDSVHVGYLCPSQHVMAVGDMRTGKMDAFFLYVPGK